MISKMYEIKIDPDTTFGELFDMEHWCHANLGYSAVDPLILNSDYRWFIYHDSTGFTFYFFDDKDAVLFKLR